MPQKSALNVVLGVGSLGEDPAKVKPVADLFLSYGHYELDTARIYADGKSEGAVGHVTQSTKGLIVDTKIPGMIPNCQSPENVAKSVEESLKQLQTNKVHIMYLHAPDPATPLEDTYAAVDSQYRQGRFEKFGISNFKTAEVEKLMEIAQKNNYVKPSVYQGMYNLIERNPEDKLFPVLRKYGISFYAYSPLAGGYLAGKAGHNDHFKPDTWVGKMYRGAYMKDSFNEALASLQESAKKENLTVPELAFRWLAHHSALKKEHGDAIIIGGKQFATFESSLELLDKPALPSHLAKLANDTWQSIKDHSTPFVSDNDQVVKVN